MYRPGDAKLASETKDYEDVEPHEYEGEDGVVVKDWRGEDAPKDHDPRSTVMLPHSCEAWIIGGRAQVDAMISDLTALRERLPA